jgi:thiol-disulfide isomerase/thioredoxin
MILGKAPEFQNISGWINSEPLTLNRLKGRVVFLDFWTYSCYNCQNTLPEMNKLHAKYGKKGLVIIGVHAPEFPYERKRENVERAVASAGLTYPIALDSNNTTWKLYGNHYWPRQTIIDENGEVAYEHVGEGSYREIEAKVVELLKLAKGSGGTSGPENIGIGITAKVV